jgi:exodeoxyribonuclease V gamma subunit
MLTIHRAERADRLVEVLAADLLQPAEDPFAAEVVAVPTRGIERWLAQRLSTVLGTSEGRRDGVCANIEFPFPGRLVGAALASATGVDPADDPWRPECSVWPLMSVVGEHLDEPWLAPLSAHLGGSGSGSGRPGNGDGNGGGDGARPARRFGAVRHLADLFDHYGIHRPTMITAWAAGDDTDGHGARLQPDVAWQAPLWRCLRERLGSPSAAERLGAACLRLRDEPALVDLPPRLALFGLTRLPASYVEVLAALGERRDVRLFLLHPSPALWDRITGRHGDRSAGLPLRRDDPTAKLARNPLVATWGRDAREMQLVLWTAVRDRPVEDRHHELVEPAATLLHRLQAGVRTDALPPGPPLPGDRDERAVLDRRDTSVQVHACHGRARQVEVARDAILHLLADDPTLEPRDVIVMCPDIEAFAPLIDASFGAGRDATPGGADGGGTRTGGLPELGFRLADRSLRQTNPVLAAVAELLELATTRVTASHVIDFAGRAPVRRRFRFDDDDLTRLEEWVASTGIRWGLDAAHRAPYQLDRIEANTWKAGLDRLLLGVTMAEDELRLVGGVLPLDDVDSGDIDLAGRLAELVDRLHAAIGDLSEPKPVAAWAATIGSAADALAATSERDAWQRLELDRILRDVVAEAGPLATDEHMNVALPEIRALLADRLRGRPTRANFRTGHLTMCTLVPMRSVPHRVVCVLGLDDGTFPRRTAPDGDDIIERAPRVGDRDPRSEDRQLLLDALMAATDHLVITYCGRDERTNAVRPPAVPLGELLDVIDRTARPGGARGDRTRARDHVVVEHPLQPFDVRNFVDGELVPDRRWSFDAVALGGARAARAPRTAPAVFLDGPLLPEGGRLVELDDLVAFVQHPVKAFLRQRLGTSITAVEDEPADGLPLELNALEQWDVGRRLLEQRMAGLDLDVCLEAERARGVLPPGSLGEPNLERAVPLVEGIVAAATGAVPPGSATTSVDVNVDVGDGWSVVGTVPDVTGDVVRTVTYSRVGPKQRLAAWVRLLALTAGHPDRPFSALTVGRGNQGEYGMARIPTLGPDQEARAAAALAHLDVLVDLYARGMCEPLPVYCKTSAAYAAAHPTRRDGKARTEWESGYRYDHEDREPVHQLVLGGIVRYDDLIAARPRPGEDGPGWCSDEPSRFGRYARRMWDALLAVEKRSNL